MGEFTDILISGFIGWLDVKIIQQNYNYKFIRIFRSYNYNNNIYLFLFKIK